MAMSRLKLFLRRLVHTTTRPIWSCDDPEVTQRTWVDSAGNEASAAIGNVGYMMIFAFSDVILAGLFIRSADFGLLSSPLWRTVARMYRRSGALLFLGVLQNFGCATILMTSPISHEPRGLDSNPNRGPSFIYLCSTMMLLSTVAVGLRFLSRRLSKAQVAWSDWTILIALVNLPRPCLGSTFKSNSIQPLGWLPVLLMISCRLDSAHKRHGLTSIIGVRCYGFGKHIQQTSAQDNRGFWHVFYVAEIIYPIAVAVTKTSILLFYWRNCHVAALRITNIVVGILIVMWAFSTVCYPHHLELIVKLNYRP